MMGKKPDLLFVRLKCSRQGDKIEQRRVSSNRDVRYLLPENAEDCIRNAQEQCARLLQVLRLSVSDTIL